MENQQTTSEQLVPLKEYNYAGTTVIAGISRTLEVIALKSVCENLRISWSWQFEQLKNDSHLSQLFGKEKIMSKDGKTYDMICLPYHEFQNWLWSLKPTPKMNIELWEEYKKGLVVYLLMMLKVSLDEIKRLRRIEKLYHEQLLMVNELIGYNDEALEATRRGRERRKDKNSVIDALKRSTGRDPNQLTIED